MRGGYPVRVAVSWPDGRKARTKGPKWLAVPHAQGAGSGLVPSNA